MSQRAVGLGLMVLVAVALGMGVVSYLVIKRQHPPTISASSFNRGKFGTNAFYRLIERRTGEVGRLGTTVFAWPRKATVIAVRPVTTLGEGAGYPITPLSGQALIDWLSEGNVLISFGLIWELESALELETIAPQAVVATSPAVNVGKPLRVRQLRLSSVVEEGKEETALLRLKLPEIPALSGLSITYGIVPDQLGVENLAGRPEIGLMKSFLAREGIPRPPLMEVIEVGRGRVVLVNLTQPVMNRWIGEGDNAAFALGVVELFRRQDAPVYFYEVPHGNRGGASSLARLLVTTPGGLTLLGFALAIYLILAPQMVPLRRSISPPLAWRARSLPESLQRMANLYLRMGATDLGVHGLMGGVRVYLGRRMGLSRPLTWSELERLYERLIAPRRHPLEYQAIGEALKSEKTGDFGYFASPRRLSYLAHGLALLIALAGEGVPAQPVPAGSRGRQTRP